VFHLRFDALHVQTFSFPLFARPILLCSNRNAVAA
jgi:hypothetical protein